MSTIVLIVLFKTTTSPKYIYTVREKVTQTKDSVSWDLWCWHEYSNGHVSKKYIGNFKTLGTTETGNQVETSLCQKKGVL